MVFFSQKQGVGQGREGLREVGRGRPGGWEKQDSVPLHRRMGRVGLRSFPQNFALHRSTLFIIIGLVKRTAILKRQVIFDGPLKD